MPEMSGLVRAAVLRIPVDQCINTILAIQNSPKFPTTLRHKVNVSIILSTPMIELNSGCPLGPWVASQCNVHPKLTVARCV
jgi:hypothetical protein